MSAAAIETVDVAATQAIMIAGNVIPSGAVVRLDASTAADLTARGLVIDAATARAKAAEDAAKAEAAAQERARQREAQKAQDAADLERMKRGAYEEQRVIVPLPTVAAMPKGWTEAMELLKSNGYTAIAKALHDYHGSTHRTRASLEALVSRAAKASDKPVYVELLK